MSSILKKRNFITFCLVGILLFLQKSFYYPQATHLFEHHIFFALLIIDVFVVWKAVCYLVQFKVFEKHSRIDIVCVCVFFVSLYVPMSHINQSDKSEQENRMLASFPEFITKQGINFKFGDQFNSWFSDRFFLRENLVEAYNKFFSKTDNKKAFVGKEDWLFYKRDHSIENFKNAILFTEDELKIAADYLSSIDAWCRKNGIDFYFYITPDKNKIYGEYYKKVYTKGKKDDQYSRANQLISYLQKNTSVKVLYPYDYFHQHKKTDLLYFKNDTHWNMYGAYLGYKYLLDELNKKMSIPMYKMAKFEIKTNPRGDLTNMIPGVKENMTEYKYPVVDLSASDCKDQVPMAGKVVCHNKKGHKKAYVMGDSFSISLSTYYNVTFAQTTYQKSKNLTVQDLADIKGHDIFVLERAERILNEFAERYFPKD